MDITFEIAWILQAGSSIVLKIFGVAIDPTGINIGRLERT